MQSIFAALRRSLFQSLIQCLAVIVSPALGFTANAPQSSFSLPATFEESGTAGQFTARAQSEYLSVAGDELVYSKPDVNDQSSLQIVSAHPSAWKLTDPLPGHSSYLLGNVSQWRTTRQYGSLHRANIYPGIDVILHGAEGRIEYDFVVHPNVSADSIQMLVRSARSLTVNAAGDLIAEEANGQLELAAPHAFQGTGATRHEIAVRYEVVGQHQFGFRLGAYDATLPLLIDPVLSYASTIGGSGFDQAQSVTTDSAGNVYLAGITESADFPHTSALPQQVAAGRTNVFVTKLDADGKTILYSLYFGGNNNDYLSKIRVGGEGSAYVTGLTTSTDFPVTAGAFQGPTSTTPNCYLTKIDPTGTSLVYSSILGSCKFGGGVQDLTVSAIGEVYAEGVGDSGFPLTAGSFQTPLTNNVLGFALRMNAQGSALVYSALLGDSSPNAVALDHAGNAYVTGGTDDPSFPTTANAYQTTNQGSTDAFALKLSPDGSSLLFSTLIGGSGSDFANGLTVDNQGSMYITGICSVGSVPGAQTPYPVTANAAFQTASPSSGFLTKVNSRGTGLAYSTYLDNDVSSSFQRAGWAVALAGLRGNMYVAKSTTQSYGFGETGNPAQVIVQGTDVLEFNSFGAVIGSFFVPVTGPGFWFDASNNTSLHGFASVRRGPVTLEALYIAGNQQPEDTLLSGLGRTFGSTSGSNAPVVKVDLLQNGGSTLSVDVAYLAASVSTTAAGTYSPVTKAITLTSSGNSLPFHIAVPKPSLANLTYTPISVSQTDGVTPASVEVTIDPNQFPSGEPLPLIIVTPGAAQSATVIPVLVQQVSANTNATASRSATRGWEPGSFGLAPTLTIEERKPASGTALQSSEQRETITATPSSVSFRSSPEIRIQTGTVSVESSGAPSAFTIGSPLPSWLEVAPLAGITPTTLSITVTARELPRGLNRHRVMLSTGSGEVSFLDIEALSGPAPIEARQAGKLATPAMIAAGARFLITSRFSNALVGNETAYTIPLPTTLGGYQVTVNEKLVPLVSILDNEIEAQMPVDIAPGKATVTLRTADGKPINSVQITIADQSPSLYRARQSHPVRRTDGSPLNLEDHVRPGEILIAQLTGTGRTNGRLVTGNVPFSRDVSLPTSRISATVGGKNAAIISAAMSSTMPGILEVQIQVPDLASDDYFARITVGSEAIETFAVRIEK